MKVFILTEGGGQAGFGHITRCLALSQAFEENGILPQFIINCDESVKDMIKGKKYKIVNWLKNRKMIFNSIKGANIVIIDSYLANLDFYRKVSDLVKTAAYIDDYKRIEYPRGIIVNSAIYASRLNYPKRKGITYLLGNKYALLRKEFWNVPKKKIPRNFKNVIITFGGNDTRNMSLRVLNLLISNYPDVNKKVIIGRGFKNICDIEMAKDKNTRLIYYPNAWQIKEEMLKNDIAISGGGQTLYELAKIGMPTIAIVVSENQSNNVKGLQGLGFLKWAGYHDDKCLMEKLEQSIKDMTFEKRSLMNKVGQKYIDGRGAERVMTEIVSN